MSDPGDRFTSEHQRRLTEWIAARARWRPTLLDLVDGRIGGCVLTGGPDAALETDARQMRRFLGAVAAETSPGYDYRSGFAVRCRRARLEVFRRETPHGELVPLPDGFATALKVALA